MVELNEWMNPSETGPWLLEVCVADVFSLKASLEAGAHRIELCSGLAEGGITPSGGFVQWAVREACIPVRVLIRPRAGDFCYSKEEVDIMIDDIRSGLKAGVDGFVLGALTPSGSIDEEVMGVLVKEVGTAPWTFHRAFDFCTDPKTALLTIIDLGADTVLTSGQAATAEMGAAKMAEWVALADGRVDIMAGAGINSGNIATIARQSGCTSFHLSGRSVKQNALSPDAKPKLNAPGLPPDHHHLWTDPVGLKSCIHQLCKNL